MTGAEEWSINGLPAFCDSRGFAFEQIADLACAFHPARNRANRKRLPWSPAHWQEKYNEAVDVSPPDSTAVNSVRLTCADSTLVASNQRRHVLSNEAEAHNIQTYADARLSVSLLPADQGTKRTLLTIADNRRSAPADRG